MIWKVVMAGCLNKNKLVIMEKLYNKFSDKYDDLFLQNILHFQETLKAANYPINEFACFYPSFGIKPGERVEFIIYGQAVYGWTPFLLNDNKQADILQRSCQNSNSYYEKGNHNPIDWVNVQWCDSVYDHYCEMDDEIPENYYDKYRASHSFFWNVTYKLICDYYFIPRQNREWSEKIVWSNLYKLTQQRKNPEEYEKKIQLNYSIELFKKEIEELKPKYCILLTNGTWWEPFRNFLNPKSLNKYLPSEIVHNDMYNETQIIVTTRPRFGKSETHVRQILDVISSSK